MVNFGDDKTQQRKNEARTKDEVSGDHPKLCLPPTWGFLLGILPLLRRSTIELPHLSRCHDILDPRGLVHPFLDPHTKVFGYVT